MGAWRSVASLWRVETADRLGKRYGGFFESPTTSMFYRSVKWTSAYDIRFEPVAFSMASIKVLPENGFVR